MISLRASPFFDGGVLLDSWSPKTEVCCDTRCSVSSSCPPPPKGVSKGGGGLLTVGVSTLTVELLCL